MTKAVLSKSLHDDRLQSCSDPQPFWCVPYFLLGQLKQLPEGFDPAVLFDQISATKPCFPDRLNKE
jgi:hypothetical protein